MAAALVVQMNTAAAAASHHSPSSVLPLAPPPYSAPSSIFTPSAPPALASASASIPPPVSYDQYLMNRFREIAGRYEIRPDFCAKLRQLEDYDIVIIADDSGSMNTRVQPGGGGAGAGAAGAFAPSKTRWNELCEFCSIVSEIGSVMDKDGIDIYFLNRPPALHVRSPTDPHFQSAFLSYPTGSTPLVACLQNVIQARCRTADAGRRILIVIATDGAPDGGESGVAEFIKTIRYRPDNTNVTILACTDDSSTVEYLNKIDKIIPGVDVVDDYRSELIEIRRAQGEKFPFSYGDYVVKVLLGSIDPVMDKLDERRGVVSSCCCVA